MHLQPNYTHVNQFCVMYSVLGQRLSVRAEFVLKLALHRLLGIYISQLAVQELIKTTKISHAQLILKVWEKNLVIRSSHPPNPHQKTGQPPPSFAWSLTHCNIFIFFWKYINTDFIPEMLVPGWHTNFRFRHGFTVSIAGALFIFSGAIAVALPVWFVWYICH